MINKKMMKSNAKEKCLQRKDSLTQGIGNGCYQATCRDAKNVVEIKKMWMI